MDSSGFPSPTGIPHSTTDEVRVTKKGFWAEPIKYPSIDLGNKLRFLPLDSRATLVLGNTSYCWCLCGWHIRYVLPILSPVLLVKSRINPNWFDPMISQSPLLQPKFMVNAGYFWFIFPTNLVGGPGPPLWKIWLRQLGWLETQYMGK